MEKVERAPKQWRDVLFRVELVSELEAIANLIAYDIPATYSGDDELFAKWISSQHLIVANYMRDMKRWLAMPREDTREYFLQALGQIVICAGLGVWDEVLAEHSELVEQRVGRLGKITSAARTLFTSVFPIGVLGLLHKFDSTLQLSAYLWIGSVLWLAVGLFSITDPLYSTRLEAFSSILRSLSGGKKD